MTDVTMYTSSVCPYCTAARSLLESLGASVEEIPLDHDSALRQELSARLEGWRTVPMIFIGDEFIGGFRELQELHRSGGLEQRLAEAC